jgi:competence protein ComEC
MIQSFSQIWTLPGIKLCLSLALGIWLADIGGFSYSQTLTITLSVLGIGVIALLFPSVRKRNTPTLIIGLSMLATLGYLLQSNAIHSVDAGIISFADGDSELHLSGSIASEPELRKDGYSFVLEADSLSVKGARQRVSGMVMVFVRERDVDPFSLAIAARGSSFSGRGWLRLPRVQRVPNGFNYRSYLNRKGITTTFNVNGSERYHTRDAVTWSPWKAIHSFRSYIHSSIYTNLGEAHRGIVLALLTGERGLISEETLESFRISGVIHILAVSGLHTGIIFLVLTLLFMRAPLQWRVPLIIAGLAFYAALTGMNPPVIRASIIATVFLAGSLLQRNSNPVNAISIAGALILLFDPQSLFTLSFQLSFLAAISIALFYKPIDVFIAKLRWTESSAILRGVRGLVAVSIAAQLGTAPVVLSTFGSISVVSILANIIVIPIVFSLVITTLAGLIAALPASLFGSMFFHATELCVSVLDAATGMFAQIPMAEIHIAAQPIWIWLSYALIVMYFAFAKTRLRNRVIVSVLIITALILFTQLSRNVIDSNGRLEVTFLDVGQGDATLITTPGGKSILVDAGPNWGSTDAGERIIIPYLQSRGITNLHALVLSHFDDDHIGGADAVLATIKTEKLYYSGVSEVKASTRALDSIADLKMLDIHPVYAGDRISVDSTIRIYVLSPQRTSGFAESSNDESVILLIVYGETALLLTGDADIAVENDLLHRYGDFLDCDILKVGHHGSRHSSGESFITSTSPSISIISCGKNNRYKHPAKRVVRLLQDSGSDVFRTDVHGTLIFSSDGESFERVNWNH